MRGLLTQLGVATASPIAFILVGVYGIVWASVGHLDFHGIATLATWIMTLVIQRAEHRDTQAIHAKLDELLHVNTGASNHLTRVDDSEPEDIVEQREKMRRED